MPNPVVAQIGGTVFGAALSADAAGDAAEIQAASGQSAINAQTAASKQAREDLQPFAQAGYSAIPELLQALGIAPPQGIMIGGQSVEDQIISELGPRPIGPGTGGNVMRAQWDQKYDDLVSSGKYQEIPGTDLFAGATTTDPVSQITDNPLYQTLFGEATRTINAGNAARGKLGSGDTFKDLTNASLAIGSDIQNQRVNQLFNLVGLGSNAAGGQATNTLNTGANVANLLTGIGNAQAAGRVGQANAITSGINTGIGLYDLLKGQE